MNAILPEPLGEFGEPVGVARGANERGGLGRCIFAKVLILEGCSHVS